jgi:hypothetical protein
MKGVLLTPNQTGYLFYYWMSESRIECGRRQSKSESDFVVAEAVYYVDNIDEFGWSWVVGQVSERLEPTEVHRGKLSEWYGLEYAILEHLNRVNINIWRERDQCFEHFRSEGRGFDSDIWGTRRRSL